MLTLDNLEEGVEYDEEPFKERSLGWYIEARTKADRKPFEPWEVAVQYIRNGRFRRMQDLAAYFGHSPCWSTDFKALAVRQKVFTVEEWRSCFKRGTTLGRPISDPRTWEGQQQQEQASQPQPGIEEDESDESYLPTRDGYRETYPVVLERIRQGELVSERAICRFYCMGQKAMKALREDFIQRGLVTEDEWSGYMRRRTRKRQVVNQPSQQTKELSAATAEGECNSDAAIV